MTTPIGRGIVPFKSASLAAIATCLLGLAGPALAQSAPAEPPADTVAPDTSTITVTATRIVRDGYSAPTPVTVFGQEDLARASENNVFNAINQLPSLAGSNSNATFGTTQSTGTGGLSTLNLRGLGTNRTLTLLDGQRVVGALNIGVTDAGAFPQSLVKRVDIVTGGASASWGSDAVAGVVNYVLDHDFVGIKGNANGSITTYGDDKNYSLSLTAGFKFLDDRAHFVISGEYQDDPGITRGIGSRKWYDGTRILQRTIAGTPAGQPQYIVAPQVDDARLAPGGLITAGPLQGTAFGPGGTPFRFQYGTVVATNMQGGDQSGDIGNNSNLVSSLNRKTLYARLQYDLSSRINVYATYNYGSVKTTAHSYPGQYRTGNLTIQCDNAFLPASISAACAANNITNFAYGSFIADLPDTIAVNTRSQNRWTLGFDGSFDLFGKNWKINGYGEVGKTRTDSSILNNTLSPRLLAAIDSVRGPNGTIVCRSTVAQADGCVPFNIIGTGVASQSAISWVSGTPYLVTNLEQDVGAISVSGEPFSLWAGPVSLAFGGEYRKESFGQSADAPSNNNNGDPLLSAAGLNWFTGNFRPSSGALHVWEGYIETLVPLLDSRSLGKINLSLAARATDYSQAGFVTTWKAGGTWDTPLPGLRLRTIRSRDIRAPNLSELFRAPQNFAGTVVDRDPRFNGLSQTINQATLANLNLKPEKSDTFEVGGVYTPAWLPGFSASIDYYNIKVKGAIGTVSAQQTVDLCFQGNTTLCNLISRNAAGQISEVRLVPINLASQKTAGIDIEMSYRRRLSDFLPQASGTITVRALATHVSKFDTFSGLPGAVVLHIAGENAGQNGYSIPHWRLYGTQSWAGSRASLTFIERYVSPGVIANNWIECTSNCPAPTINNPTVNNNHVKGALYLDIGMTYKITPKVEFYGKVDNVFNLDPPLAATAGANPYLVRSINAALYDILGRVFRVGVRFTY